VWRSSPGYLDTLVALCTPKSFFLWVTFVGAQSTASET
jgi:hypothetical protein